MADAVTTASALIDCEDDWSSAAPWLAAAQMKHETQYTRLKLWLMNDSTTPHGPLRVGIGGPVGSGKTALTLELCRRFRDDYNIAAVTNDIYTKEDAQFLVDHAALSGGPHHRR